MTKQVFKQFALTFLSLLVACPSFAQGKLAHPIRSHHPSSPVSPAGLQKAQPAGSSYSYTIFDYPGTFYTGPDGLNLGAATSKLEIVGLYASGSSGAAPTSNFRMYAAQAADGTITEAYQTFNLPNVTYQSANGVNDAGQVVGQYQEPLDVVNGFELTGTTFTTINVPFSGAVNTFPNGVNNSGEIVGSWSGTTDVYHGFTLTDGTYSSFDYPGATSTFASSLNNTGDIVGTWVDTSGVAHGFVLHGGTYTPIDVPGAFSTGADGINDSGDITGVYCQTDNECNTVELIGQQGFLLSHGTYTTFTISDALLTELVGINDKGWILGLYEDVAGYEHGFLAVP